MIRQRIIYRGHVQGVGFRYTTRQIAQGYDVTGTVRNLTNGTVEVIVEGDAKEVAAFRSALADDMASYIRDCNILPESYLGEFAEFSIRH